MAKKWDEMLYYDETSPSGLRWKVERRTGSFGQIILKRPGDIAGTCTKKGYWQVAKDGKTAFAHRVVMELNGINVEEMEVDHIDGNPSNNALTNLRLATPGLNKRNLKKHRDSLTLKTGVTFAISRHGFTKVVAQWYDESGVNRKSFSARKYGLLPAYAMACKVRDDSISKLNSRGFGYTERHGK